MHEPDDKRDGESWHAPFIKELQRGWHCAILAGLRALNQAASPVYRHLENRFPVPAGCRFSYFPPLPPVALTRGVSGKSIAPPNRSTLLQDQKPRAGLIVKG
jgi:hypothetical protein